MEFNPRIEYEIRSQTEIGLAYVAAYIDGEGSMTIRALYSAYAEVAIHTTFRPILSLLSEVFER